MRRLRRRRPGQKRSSTSCVASATSAWSRRQNNAHRDREAPNQRPNQRVRSPRGRRQRAADSNVHLPHDRERSKGREGLGCRLRQLPNTRQVRGEGITRRRLGDARGFLGHGWLSFIVPQLRRSWLPPSPPNANARDAESSQKDDRRDCRPNEYRHHGVMTRNGFVFPSMYPLTQASASSLWVE